MGKVEIQCVQNVAILLKEHLQYYVIITSLTHAISVYCFIAQTKFMECENCRHFFLAVNGGRGRDKSYHDKIDFKNVPSPKKVWIYRIDG